MSVFTAIQGVSPASGSSSPPTTETFTGSGTWVVPAGVTSVVVQLWGSGANGSNGVESEFGGGGGAYAASILVVTPESSIDYVVGQANGEDTSWQDGTVLARGGSRGDVTGTGGQAADSVGDTKYSGGNGGVNSATSVGGGGGGGGSTEDGGNGGAGNGQSGTAGVGGNEGGGNGGRGGSGAAQPAGGGGSGGISNTSGERGKIKITYTLP